MFNTSTVLVSVVAAALVAYGIGQISDNNRHDAPTANLEPASREQAPTVAAPSVTAPGEVLVRPPARLQPAPPVQLGTYSVPRVLYLTVTGTTDAALGFLVGTVVTLNYDPNSHPGTWVGTVQLPLGGLTVAAQLNHLLPVPPPLPSWQVVAMNGSRDLQGAIDPSRWVIEATGSAQASSMSPVLVSGTWRGRSKVGTQPNLLMNGQVAWTIRP